MGIIERPDKIHVEDVINKSNRAFYILDSILLNRNDNSDEIRSIHNSIIEREVISIAKQISVDELSKYLKGVRIGLLKDCGINNIYDLNTYGISRVKSIRGISLETANRFYRVTSKMITQIRDEVKIHINVDHVSEEEEALISACTDYMDMQTVIRDARALREKYNNDLQHDYLEAAKLRSSLKWVFSSKAQKRQRIQALKKLEEALEQGLLTEAEEIYLRYEDIKQSKRSGEDVWNRFRINAADYYALIESITGKDTEKVSHRLFPEDLATSIDSLDLNTEGLRATLRSYQEFGVKYVLHQRRVLLGDEMGLGKTVQAIAAMTHLQTEGKNHYLVVCPLGILVNWMREIKKFSALNVYSLRDHTDASRDEWVRAGGVAVVNYEYLEKAELPETLHLDLIVVDEAHYVKNPEAKRTQAVVKIQKNADRVLFMTGTPLENKIEEMVFLLSVLNRSIANKVRAISYMSISEAFRKEIAPVYMRRVREDVLKELPEKIELEDWCEMNSQEIKAYVESLQDGSYMRIRQVSWNAGAKDSTKLSRLVEICEEAAQENRKIVVFSYFHNTISMVKEALGDCCYGPLSGKVNGEERQRLIDDFQDAPNGSVLVAQIGVGGVGFNIQSASVVVICEPQWKPTIEDQAISRVHRMGQVKDVIVHRLLSQNSIDERMLELLRFKTSLFNEYADESEMNKQAKELLDNRDMAELVKKELAKYSVGECSGYNNEGIDSSAESYLNSVQLDKDTRKCEHDQKVTNCDNGNNLSCHELAAEQNNNSDNNDESQIVDNMDGLNRNSQSQNGENCEDDDSTTGIIEEETPWAEEYKKLKNRYSEEAFEGTLGNLRSINRDLNWRLIEKYVHRSDADYTLKVFLMKDGIIRSK